MTHPNDEDIFTRLRQTVCRQAADSINNLQVCFLHHLQRLAEAATAAASLISHTSKVVVVAVW